MIKIENPELFGFETYVSNGLVLVNVFIDPEVVELKNYRRTPFSSIIIKSDTLIEKLREIEQIDNTFVKKKKRMLVDELLPIIESSSLITYNLYTDNEYDTYKNIFEDVNLHTVLLFVNSEYRVSDTDKSILIFGYPVDGIITPIVKSPNYLLLNGSFISTKPFTMGTNTDGLYYDKLIYCLVDIKTSFEYSEYNQVSESHGVGYDRRFIVGCLDMNESPTIYQKNDERIIPIAGREYLFKKPDKNMFCLSDVPSDIITKKYSLSRKI